MKIDANKTLQQRVQEVFEKTEDKNEAMFNAIEMIVSEQNKELIEQIVSEAKSGSKGGLRQLSKDEVAFYEQLRKGAKEYNQSVTAEQIDIIPTDTIDYTLKDVKEPSGIRKLIKFTPANVKNWLFGSKTGSSAWGALTDAIASEITGAITSAKMDEHKLSAFCVIPKAIRDLEIGYVDRYFTAVLKEAMEDGIEYGYLYGNGKIAPIGIKNKISTVNASGEHTAKTKVTTVTGFSPKKLAAAIKTLTNNGTRKVGALYVICNPLDKAEYVDPALYGDSFSGGWVNKSFLPIEVISSANVTQGDGFLTIGGAYTMGFQEVKVDEYKETKALDDADVLIAKAYGNGRADDDNAAVYFDVTKLEEYKPTIITEATETAGE